MVGRKAVLGVLATAALLAAPLSALAIQYGALGGRPANPRPDNPRTDSIFVHTLEAGAVQEEGILVINNTKEEKTAQVYAVDSTPSTGGAFACAQRSAGKQDVGAWIAVDEEITLAPGATQVIPFDIVVPANASVGEHNGCIVVQEKEPPRPEGQSGVRISTRLGLRVAVTIPGELERALEIAGLEVVSRGDGSFLLQPAVRNVGNVSIDANIRLVTRNLFGLIYQEHGGEFPVLRGETLEQNFELKQPFWGGWYTTDLVVEYDRSEEATVGVQSGGELTRLSGPSVTFFSWPTAAAGAVYVAVLLALLIGGWLLRVGCKRRAWIRDSWVAYTVQDGDDLTALAKSYDVSWRLLAKVNKLDPPYSLRPGQSLKVPPPADGSAG
jgi:hypothetical protein